MFIVTVGLSTRRVPKAALLIACSLPLLSLWALRNYVEFGAVRPLGRVVEQTGEPYVAWLNTWVDDPRYVHTHWWHRNENAPQIDFAAAAVRARTERPLQTLLVVPTKRLMMTWIRLPSYINNTSENRGVSLLGRATHRFRHRACLFTLPTPVVDALTSGVDSWPEYLAIHFSVRGGAEVHYRSGASDSATKRQSFYRSDSPI
jgi:hypothetical protein